MTQVMNIWFDGVINETIALITLGKYAEAIQELVSMHKELEKCNQITTKRDKE